MSYSEAKLENSFSCFKFTPLSSGEKVLRDLFTHGKHTCLRELQNQQDIFVCACFPQWQGETQEFCPNAKVVLVGCKLDMRTDVNTLRELSKQRLIPVTHEQVRRREGGRGGGSHLGSAVVLTS